MSIESARHRIHDDRLRLGLSPDLYGVHIKVSGMTVRRVERGHLPGLPARKKFADALGVSHTELFGTPDIGQPDMPTMVRDCRLRKPRQAMAA